MVIMVYSVGSLVIAIILGMVVSLTAGAGVGNGVAGKILWVMAIIAFLMPLAYLFYRISWKARVIFAIVFSLATPLIMPRSCASETSAESGCK